MGTDFCKDQAFYTCANNDGSIFSMADRAKHRERRKILSPRFSKQAAEAGAPGVLRRLQHLIDYVEGQTRMNKTCDATDLMRALTVCLQFRSLRIPILTHPLPDQCGGRGPLWGLW
jgi:cytochrome P450